jgi:ATP-binding protein involved in chromosome partitioning
MKDFNRVTTQEAILQALATIRDPDLGRDIVSLGFIKDLKVSGENISFSVELTTPACPVRYQMKEDARRAVLSLPGIKNVDVTMRSKVRRPKSEETDKLLPLVKNIVPVASGKGGVGKSTVRQELGNRSFQAWRPCGIEGCRCLWPSVSATNIEVFWSPSWDPSKMSEAAKLQSGMM